MQRGSGPRSLHWRWVPPACVTLFVAGVATSGFAFTLRHYDAHGQLTAGFKVAYALTAACMTGCVTCLWLCWGSDPGFVLPNAARDPTLAAVLAGTASAAELGWTADPVTGKFLDAQGHRYCDVCNLWRPHRAMHCHTCGFCVERHDHHCAVVGGCIARRNHALFAAFLSFAGGGVVVLAACSSFQLHDHVRSGGPGFTAWPTSVHLALMIFYWVTCYAVVPFAATHVAMVLGNRTTRGLMRGGDQQWRCCTGLDEVCCVPLQRRDAVFHQWLRLHTAAAAAEQQKSDEPQGGVELRAHTAVALPSVVQQPLPP